MIRITVIMDYMTLFKKCKNFKFQIKDNLNK